MALYLYLKIKFSYFIRFEIPRKDWLFLLSTSGFLKKILITNSYFSLVEEISFFILNILGQILVTLIGSFINSLDYQLRIISSKICLLLINDDMKFITLFY